MSSNSPAKFIAIDWGGKNIGIAIGNDIAKMASPLEKINNSEDVINQIADLAKGEGVEAIIVGLPRNLAGEETAQSATIRMFAADLSDDVECQVLLQDETLSTQAAQGLRAKFPDADEDSLAATVILQDYLDTL
ncbi:MAG: Holliday junction resolvase RuvX [Candidatus Saccharimonadales bacterium]